MLDFHNHVLPGIDDGSPDLETTLLLVNGLNTLGFDSIKGSPHIIADTHPNNLESISSAFDSAKHFLNENNQNSLIGFSAEHMIDDVFMSKIKNKEPLLCVKDKNILVELSYAQKPDHLESVSFQLQIDGYIPILAHPERYPYYHKDYKNTYTYLKDLGFDFQLNLLSLTPYYGKDVQQIAEKLLDEGFYDYACTDLHHTRHLEALNTFFTKDSLAELFKKHKLRNEELI
jgi:tyrosine-protein phosphatase YwqE